MCTWLRWKIIGLLCTNRGFLLFKQLWQWPVFLYSCLLPNKSLPAYSKDVLFSFFSLYKSFVYMSLEDFWGAFFSNASQVLNKQWKFCKKSRRAVALRYIWEQVLLNNVNNVNWAQWQEQSVDKTLAGRIPYCTHVYNVTLYEISTCFFLP